MSSRWSTRRLRIRAVGFRLPALVLLAPLVAACSGSDRPGDAAGGPAVGPVPVDTLVTTASGLIGSPTDLAVGPDGTLYVLDGRNAVVHRIASDGEHLGSFGGEGQGPAELSRPRTVAVGRGDTLRVVDGGNGRLQVYSTAGEHLGTRPLPPNAVNYPSAVAPDGTVVASSIGLDSARATVHGPDGTLRASVGRRATAVSPGVIRITEMKQEIAEGGVPDLFHNTSFPAITASGSVWLNVPSAGRIERYAPDGTPLDTAAVEDPRLAGIEDHFRARNADPEFRGLYPLMYAVDQHAVGEDLYLLLNPAGDGPAVVHRYGPGGTRTARWLIESVRGPINIAVDRERGRLYFGIADTAEILAVDLAALGQ